jgi:hypothetical protein
MAVCAEYRIPHSHFLGGPAVWTPADRDKAIWWQVRQAETCRACGTRPDEWDPNLGGHRRAYAVEERVCAGCEVLQRAEAQHAEDEPALRGAHLVLVARKGAT